MRLLIVDAHTNNYATLKRVLEQNFFAVDWHVDAGDGCILARLNHYDLVIIEGEIPPLGARSICRQLRMDHDFPILIIGKSSEPEEIASLLNTGADDYLKRPFSLVEALARIRALLRRSPVPRRRNIRIDDLHIDAGAEVVVRGKREIHLTRTQYRLLEFLALRPGEIVSKETIIEHLWGRDASITSGRVETHVSAIRQKIDGRAKAKLLRNVPGRGYRLG